jgi:S1-C subfamily serine protease
MRFRNLRTENNNHYSEWHWVHDASSSNKKRTDEEKRDFGVKWGNGTASLGDWLKAHPSEIAEIMTSLDASQIDIANDRKRLLYDLWLEYKVQYGFMNKIKDVVTYTPHQISAYAETELKQLNQFLTGGLSTYLDKAYRADNRLDSEADFKRLTTELNSGLSSKIDILDKDPYHQAEALLRYQMYLQQLIASGIEDMSTRNDPDPVSFKAFWPELDKLPEQLIVEYSSRKFYYDDNSYVDYHITSVAGCRSPWELKNHLKNLFKPGFDLMLTAISSFSQEEQRSTLSSLREEAENLRHIITEDEYVEEESEHGPRKDYRFKKFDRIIYKGENDLRFALMARSRTFFAYKMIEYPLAWLEGIEEISRKFEHAINNLDLIASWSERPVYNVDSLFSNVYVVESAEGAIQGTAFNLAGVGLVTCDHCVRNEADGVFFNDLIIYHPQNLAKIMPVRVHKGHSHIDLATLNIISENTDFLKEGLEMGDSDNMKQLAPVTVAGYPNFSPGDSGYITEGQVTGFRTISAIKNILVSNVLVEGNSGGPAFDINGKVIGVAVTGAQNFVGANRTEKHGLIPINALGLIV